VPGDIAVRLAPRADTIVRSCRESLSVDDRARSGRCSRHHCSARSDVHGVSSSASPSCCHSSTADDGRRIGAFSRHARTICSRRSGMGRPEAFEGG
jgi:hypothetical protein